MGLLDDLKMGLGFEKPTQAFKDATENTMNNQRKTGKRRFQSTPANSSGQNPLQGLFSLLGGSKGSDPNSTEDLGLGGLKSFFGNRENAPKTPRGDAMIRATMEDKLPGYFDPTSREYVPWYVDLFDGGGINASRSSLAATPATSATSATKSPTQGLLGGGNVGVNPVVPGGSLPGNFESIGTSPASEPIDSRFFYRHGDQLSPPPGSFGGTLVPLDDILSNDQIAAREFKKNIASRFPQVPFTEAKENYNANLASAAARPGLTPAPSLDPRGDQMNPPLTNLQALMRDLDVRNHPRFADFENDSISSYGPASVSPDLSPLDVANRFHDWLSRQPSMPQIGM
jgi:hypothetical protein